MPPAGIPTRFVCGCRPPRVRRTAHWRGPLLSACTTCGARWQQERQLHQLPPNWKARDETISPRRAARWLAYGWTREGPNHPEIVDHYVHLMRTGQWRDMTLGQGGLKCAISFTHGGYVVCGLQRLEACVRADHTFRAVVAWPRDPVTGSWSRPIPTAPPPAGWLADWRSDSEA